jgi:hypothetical protein
MSIDYGMGLTNIDRDNDIRYGCISVHSLSGEAEPLYPDTVEVTCPKCKHCWETSETCGSDTQECPECGEDFEDSSLDELEPIGWDYTAGDDDYTTEFSETLMCVFVTKSPYVTRGRFCSPCAPGAVDLDSPDECGELAYCFGHDFFEGGVAPYPVFDAKTDEKVEPKG